MTKISNQYSLTNILTADLANSRLGINNVSPAYGIDLLTANGARFKGSSTYNTLLIDNSTANGGGGIYFMQNGSVGGGIGSSGWYGGDTSNDLFLLSDTSKNIRFSTNGNNERMRITSSGNVGIGTTSPSGKLHIRTDTDSNVTFTGEFQYSLNNAGNAFTNYTLSTLQSVFSTNGAERMRLTSGGNLLVGTTTDSGFKLNVNGTGNFTGAITGTTATLSGAITSKDVYITNSANADVLEIFQSPSVLNSFIDYPSGRSLILRNKGTAGGLTLASTGAATFSSSVTATSATFSGVFNAVTISSSSSASNVQLKVNNGANGDIYAGVAASDGSSVFTGTTA